MIRLFRDVWLLHEDESASGNPHHYDWTSANRLAKAATLSLSQPWDDFLELKEARLICSEQDFGLILFSYWKHLLKSFSLPDTQSELWNLYLLELFLNGKRHTFEKLKQLDTSVLFSSVKNLEIQTFFQKIKFADLGFEFLLPQYLLDGKCKSELLRYVRWCCWSLLASELQLFLNEIKTDIFSGHIVLGHKTGLYHKKSNTLIEEIQNSAAWKLVEDENLLEIFPYRKANEGVTKLKEIFPTAESMLVIFNNHARAHRDEQGVNSFAEPIELIYADQYEELLHRDMQMDFRITYASEHLKEQIVATIISKVYRSVRENGSNNQAYLKNYELTLSS